MLDRLGARCRRLVVFVVCCVFAALVLRRCLAGRAAEPPVIFGGGARDPSPRRGRERTPGAHIVVDALNLTHRLWGRVSEETVLKTVDLTSPALKAQYSGRVMYVVKDRENAFNNSETHKQFAECAKRNEVYLYAVERYEDVPLREWDVPREIDRHSARGRDDFYMSVLATRWKCPVLTDDKFRDFPEFRDIQPFRVKEYSYWKDEPDKDFIAPADHQNMRRPRTVKLQKMFRAVATRPHSPHTITL